MMKMTATWRHEERAAGAGWIEQEDRQRVGEMLRKGRESARVLRRASILSHLVQGQKIAQIAANLGVVRKTVRIIARRYQQEGLDSALHEKPRPGKARALDVNQSQRIIAMVCGPQPAGQARWSVRLIAEEAVKRRRRWDGKRSASCSTATI